MTLQEFSDKCAEVLKMHEESLDHRAAYNRGIDTCVLLVFGQCPEGQFARKILAGAWKLSRDIERKRRRY